MQKSEIKAFLSFIVYVEKGDYFRIDESSFESWPFTGGYYILSFFVGLSLFVAGFLSEILG